MTDLGAKLLASLDAQNLVADILRDGNELLRVGNHLFHTPADQEVFLETLTTVERIRRTLGDLDRLIRHPDEH